MKLSKDLPFITLTVTCGFMVVLNILRFSLTSKLQSLVLNHVDFSLAADGYPRQLPLNIKNAVMIFNDTPHYGLHDVLEWESLTPPGNGWVVLNPGLRSYAVTMYHQLHCLNAMRYDLTQSKIGKQPTEAELGHAHHCYNYIRQGLQCGLDLTLESKHGEGSGIAHVCRDWTQIGRFMEENYKKYPSYFI